MTEHCPDCGTEVKSPGLCEGCKNRIAREIEDRNRKLLDDLKNKNGKKDNGKKKK